jgi:hypothetical protein
VIQPGESKQGVYFAVFLDRPPLRPGENLQALVDSTCKRTPGCANDQYFENKFIFLTGASHVELTSLPRRKVHVLTIVLMNQNNVRVGETVATVHFRVRTGPS